MRAAITALLVLVLPAAARARQDSSRQLFDRTVLPILEMNCHVCHGVPAQRGGLDLRAPETILRGGGRGPAVVPGKPEASLLYRLVTHAEEPNMPNGGAKLADSEIARIAEWIRSLPADAARAAEGSTRIRAPGYVITAEDRRFWSFRKPVRPEVPKARDAAWVRNEIDAFVARRLEESGLRPAPPADPLALLRRVTFDLTGLPPQPDEMAAYLADRSERAYENAVERLLASPRYGERWGRHWLDLARYADSGGFEFDYDRPNAWRYRDWVIRSFNEDKPYDRFVREQLAGDELEPDNPAALVATGFCRNGPTVDNASTEQTRMDELDDMVSTTASVFLGLTVGCARCHDHKYDPIPQRDYYRMQAIFFPSRKTEALLASAAEEAAFKAANKEQDEKARPYRERIAEIERPVRERLLREKVEFFVRLAASAGALEGKDEAEYRRQLAAQFARDVKLQNEEIEALLSADELRARKEQLAEIDRVNRGRPRGLPTAMGVRDRNWRNATSHLLRRGDFRQKGEVVEPGFPSVLSDAAVTTAPAESASSTRRRQLADWIASPENPLVARVAVNRIWQYHFGKGIVRTPSDFGASGDRPSHPELLDWLATEFVARGWSIKAMHRLIVTSSTYRQSGAYKAEAAARDPENRLLWRYGLRRLEAEAVRDAILVCSARLNPEMGGPGIHPRIDSGVIATGSTRKWPVDVREGPAEWRRSVYIFVKRSVIVPLIEVFDCPDTTVSSPVRSASTIAPQALALLNNDFVLSAAEDFARRVAHEAGSEPRARIGRAIEIAFGRKARSAEISSGTEFLARQRAGYADDLSPLRDFCHALFNCNEFLYVD